MGKKATFNIVLIRHGETEENIRAIIQGQSDTKLNSTGQLQARLLAAQFPIHEFGLIYSSDLSRAYDTCRELVLSSPHSNGLGEDVIITDERLRERHFGSLQGQSLDVLIQCARDAGKTVVEFTPEGGETVSDIRRRVVDFVESRLLDEAHRNLSGPSKKVLLVSHGGVIRAMISYFNSFGHHTFRAADKVAFIPPNTSVNEFCVHYEVDSSGDHKLATVELVKLHDISHMGEELQKQAVNQKQVNNKQGPSI